MAFDYKKMRKTAERLILDAGKKKPFKLIKPDGKSVYNPETDTEERIVKEFTGKCVKKTYSAEAVGEFGNLVEAGDVEFICVFDDKTVTPTEQKDQIIFAGQTYNVLNVFETDPTGTDVIIHRVHTRRIRR